MSLLQQFIFPVTAEPIRVQSFDSDPWFHLSDLCKILGIKNPSELISQFEDTNKQTISLASGKPPWFIDEEALYTIVLRCQGALEPGTVAYQFRKWVISVIKAIRKTGQYTATAADQQHFAPFGITLQLKIDECDRYIEAAEPTADIAKVLRNRKALEQAYRAQPETKSESHLLKFIQDEQINYVKGSSLAPSAIWERLKSWYIREGILIVTDEVNLWDRSCLSDRPIKGANQVMARFLDLFPEAKKGQYRDKNGNSRPLLLEIAFEVTP
jgi:prophage antirepressor-like protein